MKKFGLFAISLLIAMFAFTSCKKPSAASVEIKIDGKDGVIYTTVPYSNIEIKVSFDSAVNDDYETANIDDFMFRVLPADNESMEDIDSDKYVALTASGLKATLESDRKTITFTNNTDQDVKFTTDTAIGAGKIMILANPDIFPEGTTKLGVISGAKKIKDRTATVKCSNISWETTYEENSVPSVEATITLEGCKIEVSEDNFELAKDVTSAIKVKVGTDAPVTLPNGVTAELVASDKDAPSDEANNCIKSTNTFKVKITGATTIDAQSKGNLVVTLPADAIDGDNLVVETTVEFEVKAQG